MNIYIIVIILFFFFQAEDGIRDIGVTGVQTCALPISWWTGAEDRCRTLRSEEGVRRGAREPLLCYRTDSHKRRRVRRRVGDGPHAHLLLDPWQRAVRRRGGRTLRREAPAPRKAHPGTSGRGDQRLRHGQPRHQLYLRHHHLRRAAVTRYAIRRPAGAPCRCARPRTIGRRDAGRGAAGHRGLVRRAVEGIGAARVRTGLSAGGEQPAPTVGLQPGRTTQRAGDPDRAAGGRSATGHPRSFAGDPGGRDHPHTDHRATGLPARGARGDRDRRGVLPATWYIRVRESQPRWQEPPIRIAPSSRLDGAVFLLLQHTSAFDHVLDRSASEVGHRLGPGYPKGYPGPWSSVLVCSRSA